MQRSLHGANYHKPGKRVNEAILSARQARLIRDRRVLKLRASVL